MNKKGQSVQLFVALFITVIVGLILLVASAQNVGKVTDTLTIANASLGTASNSTTVYLTDYRAISSVVVYNNTGAIVPSTNYTVTNNVIDPTTGGLSVSFLPSSGAAYGYTGYQWNISGTAQPTTYEPNSGGRAIAGLIIILFALAIAVISLSPTLRSGVLDMMKR